MVYDYDGPVDDTLCRVNKAKLLHMDSPARYPIVKHRDPMIPLATTKLVTPSQPKALRDDQSSWEASDAKDARRSKYQASMSLGLVGWVRSFARLLADTWGIAKIRVGVHRDSYSVHRQ